VTPEVVLRQFLDGLGVGAEHVPADPGARAALYRSLLAGAQRTPPVPSAAGHGPLPTITMPVKPSECQAASQLYGLRRRRPIEMPAPI
jgi:hypothetical protein